MNVRLAAYQAWCFATLGKMEVARAIAMDGADLAKKVPSNGAGAELRTEIDKLRQTIGGSTNRLKNSWRLFSRPFYVQILAIAVLSIGAWQLCEQAPESRPPHGPKPYIASTPVPVPLSSHSTYVRPATTPNGLPWPIRAAYLPGASLLNSDGNSRVTIDNAQNDSDVFAKLVSLDSANAYAVRQFYIPAGESFILEQVREGMYDVRYKNLNSGALARSEQFTLTETHTSEGIRYSEMTMTLYRIRNGNMQVYDLADDEF